MLTPRQLRALLALRARMVRSRGMRVTLAVAALGVPVVLAVAVWAGAHLDGDPTTTWMVPALFAGVALVAVAAPLAAGGGYQLFPDEHLVAYPVRPSTVAVGSLLLAPCNLVWLAQVLGVATATGHLTGTGPRLALAVLTTVAYVVLACAAGAALAWTVVGVRARRTGRMLVGIAGIGLGGALWLVAATGRGRAVLDAAPTSRMVPLVERAYDGPVAAWAAGFAALLLGGVVAAGAAVRACAWATTRTPDRANPAGAAGPVRRRAPRRTAFAELVAVDRASVWRAPPLRRGVLMLATVPGLAASVSGVEWSSIVMLPGIVAAGTGLLFGINVFCLDGGGAVWLATLPHDPRDGYLAKARVLAELCVLTSTCTVLLAAGRAPAPTGAEVSAVAGALLVGTAWAVAACMAISVRRPHRAELSGPRDTPAPPGAMFGNTVLLSLSATFAGAVLAAASIAADRPWLPLSIAVVLAAPALASVWLGARRWRRPERRARVIAAVAAG